MEGRRGKGKKRSVGGRYLKPIMGSGVGSISGFVGVFWSETVWLKLHRIFLHTMGSELGTVKWG